MVWEIRYADGQYDKFYGNLAELKTYLDESMYKVLGYKRIV